MPHGNSEPSTVLQAMFRKIRLKWPRGRFFVTDRRQHSSPGSSLRASSPVEQAETSRNQTLLINTTFKETRQRKGTIFILTVLIRKGVHFYRAMNIRSARIFSQPASVNWARKVCIIIKGQSRKWQFHRLLWMILCSKGLLHCPFL